MEIYLSSKRKEKITLKEYPFMDNFIIKIIVFSFFDKKNQCWVGLLASKNY
jgi:hypothetical protein